VPIWASQSRRSPYVADVEGRARIEGVAASIHGSYVDGHGHKVAEDAVFTTPCVVIIFDEAPRYQEVQSKPESKHPIMKAYRDRARSQAETREETSVSNPTSIQFRNLHMWPLLTTPQPTPQCTETDCQSLLHNGIVGHMWHHLRARIDNVRLRVLHPNIQEHQTVDIFRGLPEGSRLSPTLFGIFVADLIHELQTKFPHAIINRAPGLQHNGTTQIWIGGLLYVDDLALMSTCPRELQAM